MPHTVTEMDNGSCKNMVSNLPLLFAGGYPTSLEKITEAQLEKFIPFMVQCSLGYIQIPTLDEYSEPEWWPSDLEFIIPFSRPKAFTGNWLEKMRELVVICYSFHKCVFLLRFCTDLASYEPATLRFINNYNSTTSLYQRRTNKLLVTFRNENMLYDQAPQPSSRKCLLPKQYASQQSELQPEQMVEPAFFDIYLCDDCDAELYSYDAYVEHEKVCLAPKAVQEESDDDDVIYCGSEVLPTPMEFNKNVAISSAQSTSSFLLNFNLISRTSPVPMRTGHSSSSSFVHNPIINILDGSPDKLRRLPRRTRGAVTLSKCTSIPLSSPCGQFLLKSIKTVTSEDYQIERLERLERFCFAPPLLKDGQVVTNRPKWMKGNRLATNVAVSHKRGSDEVDQYHDYKFPRRQLSNACKMRNFLFYNKLLLNKCKPCAVKLKRLTAQEIENRNIDIRLKQLNITKSSVTNHISSLENINLKELVVVDCIDLCSSDEDELKTSPCLHESKLTRGGLNNENADMECIKQLRVDIATQNKIAMEMGTNSPTCLRKNEEFNSFISLDGSNTSNHNSFETLTPSLHLFSSINSTVSLPTVPPLVPHMMSKNNTSPSDKGELGDEAKKLLLSSVDNLTEVKENRVNDWLNNTAVSTGDSENASILLSSTTALSLNSSLVANTPSILTNNNGMSTSKALPSLMKRSTVNNSSSVEPIRRRSVTMLDLK